jgi:hypothetical protein
MHLCNPVIVEIMLAVDFDFLADRPFDCSQVVHAICITEREREDRS